MFYVYILKGKFEGKLYIGFTSNLENRIKRHNSKREKYTKKYAPWNLVYKEEFDDKTEAIKYENYLKSLKSKESLTKLIEERMAGV